MNTLLLTALLFSQTPAEPQAGAAPAVLDAKAPAEEPRRALDSLITDVEAGPLYLFQNDGRYGEGGTKYSAAEVGQQRNLAVGLRVAVEAARGNHSLIALWAPLDLTTRFTLTRDLTFRDTTFAAGTVLDHRYLFEGFRMSYLYRVVGTPKFSLRLGGSLQVRNASVEFRTVDAAPAVFSVERDIGLVFAFKARARYDAGPVYAMLDVDFFNTFGLGLAGGIHDVALTLGVPLFDGVDVFLRLRVVGGGATVPKREIYNWGNFGSAVAGVRVDLPELWRARR